ncbi:MAG: HYR domain-containing protein, partial [Acidobacteriota bacterium]
MKRHARGSSHRPRFIVFSLISAFLAAALFYAAKPAPVRSAPTELFFSEYIEGSSNNKALEIYNGTGAAVNLMADGYNIQMFFNGNPVAGLTINLTGTVANGDVYVVAQASASATILAQADQTNSSGWYNGDDAVVLRKGTTIIDSIGQVGFDPGTEWGTGLVSTADNTLRRKSSVCAGDTNAANVFDPSVEWDGFATDTFGGLGSHTASCGSDAAPSVVNTMPPNMATGVPVSANITIDFSEAVNVAGSWFSITGASSGAHTATVSGGPMSFTLDPDTDFAAGEAVTVTVFASQVTDQDADDPPDNMAANFTWSFSTAAAIVPIHNIQSNGNTSPLTGMMVTTTGVVTGVKSNGFFIQEPDATTDANPATSEGIFVFTSSAPPAAAAVGNLVQVSGTVTEFIPSADPLSPSLTEISVPSVSVLSMGNPLPAAVPLTATFPDPAGSIDQLERLEGMRVSVASLTVVHPTSGSTSEANATSTSNGVFYGVVTGVARPFRQPGIQANDPPPAGSGVTIPPVPRFDANPERIRVDSDGQTGATALDVATGAVVTGLVGPLDYSFRTYSILPDPASPPSVSGGMMATPCPAPAANEFTVASFNMERFFDTTNDPGVDDVALTVTAFNNRLNKASLAIRNFMRAPDVIGVEEVENITTLQAIATKVNNDAVAASQPDPMYQAFLVEGNDVGGIDVGFLVKGARVMVVDVTQIGKTDTFINPNTGMPELLNDRPSLVLRASIDGFAFTVIVNHLRSLNGVDDAMDGNRVRAKRRAQAEFLANFIQSRQVADPNERIISVGDYNAFQFNDGYVDSIGTIKGTPTPASQVVLASADLVTPDLTDLIDMATAAERYSFVFDGNAQALDHELVTSNLLSHLSQICYTRVNADFPEVFRNDPNRPERLSDHDMPIAYFTLPCEIACPSDITVPNDTAQCGAIVNFSTTSTNCMGVTCTPASGAFFPVGTTTVTCSESAPPITGAEAEVSLAVAPGSSCSFTVTVNDMQPPAVNCPSNISVSASMDQCSAVVNFMATGMDNCSVASVTCTPPSGATFPVGITTVTCKATDTAGNMSPTCSF